VKRSELAPAFLGVWSEVKTEERPALGDVRVRSRCAQAQQPRLGRPGCISFCRPTTPSAAFLRVHSVCLSLATVSLSDDWWAAAAAAALSQVLRL